MTSKQLQLLRKLTALANNNPNENEANLAARKVCKMLAESNFILTVTVTAQDRRDYNNQETKKSYNYERSHYNVRYRSWEDIFSYNPTGQQGKTYDGRNKKAQQTRILKCNKCGTETQTNFIGDPLNFICFGCWAK